MNTQLPKHVMERVKEKAEVHERLFSHADADLQKAIRVVAHVSYQSGALSLAQILAEVPEGGHPPRLVIEWISDDQKFHARRPLGENGEGNYIHRSEVQALRTQDLLEIERLQNKIKSLRSFVKQHQDFRNALTAERERVAKLERMVDRAHRLLVEGKAKFAPHTTNSFVDDWLQDFRALRETAETPEGKTLEGGE